MKNELDALEKRLRDHENEGVTGSDRFHLRNEAADAIRDLRAERDALQDQLEWRTQERDDALAALAAWVPTIYRAMISAAQERKP